MFKTVRDAFKIKEVRDRILFTLLCLLIVRLGSLLPTPAINHGYFASWLKDYNTGLGFLNTLTGGSFEQMSIFALNISPYITSSIIMQLLTIAIPKLEEIQKDGEEGRKKIAEWSRYLTILLAVIESVAMCIGFGNQGYLIGGVTLLNVLTVTVSFTAGSAFLMWLGEKITEKGIGNGISIILLINIVANLPVDARNLTAQFITNNSVVKGIISAIVIILIVIVTVVLVVLLQDGQRKIAVQYAQKVQGRRSVGGQSTFIPIKVNTAGVIPVIFAMSLMQFPIIISSFFGVTGERSTLWRKILYMLNQGNWFNIENFGEFKYTVGALIYIALILFFAYFYTTITFNPNEMANNLKKQSGSIPGIRPGKPTADYLNKVLNYIIFIGAIGLTIVALIPTVMAGVFGAVVSFGGTSIIIIVGVVLETMKQVESMMVVRHYKGFLSD